MFAHGTEGPDVFSPSILNTLFEFLPQQFPKSPLAQDDDDFSCNRCDEEEILGLDNSQRNPASLSLAFFSLCVTTPAQNLRYVQAASATSSQPCEVTNEATHFSLSEDSHTTQSHVHGCFSRSPFLNGVSLSTE